MGSYTDLCLDDYPLLNTKSYVDPTVMTIFRESDKIVGIRKLSERNKLVWGKIEEEDTETFYVYTNTVDCIRKRLEIMGFTLSKIKEVFSQGIKQKIEEFQRMEGFLGDHFPKDHYKEKVSLLNKLTFEKWLTIVANIKEKKLLSYNLPQDIDKLTNFMFDMEFHRYQDCVFYFGFPVNNDIRYLIRAFLEICPSGSMVTQDITEIVDAGYYEPKDEVCNIAINSLLDSYAIDEKIIVLTEGKTDRDFLDSSMKLLYPELYDYYSFMEFGVSQVEGGAGRLVSYVKAFIGASIRNRVIAVFDNDTAGHKEVNSLKKGIPRNIKVINYPNIVLAEDYPTMGPGGLINMDVNGLACSIEMYLGADILKNNNNFIPIQWMGFDKKMGRYQGTIMEKSLVQKKFRSKIKKCQKDNSNLSQHDWNGLKLICEAIFDAFNK